MNTSRLDDAILAAAKPSWLKIARVIVEAARIGGCATPDNVVIAKGIAALVSNGRLVGQEDLGKPRHSEARLPGMLATRTVNACVRNLRMLDGAKYYWAQKNNKAANDLPTWADLRPYLGRRPRCPQRGTYTLGRVEEPPKCSHGGTHAIET